MTVRTNSIDLRTKGDTDIIDITAHVHKALSDSKISEGLATVFISGSTGGITTIEYESGVIG